MGNNTSHKQILKSTSIVGGAQVFSILIGIVKTKVLAILLGPAGVGIIGVLQSILDLVRQATGFGINFSGVKDVAEASATNDEQRISRTITIVRYWALGTGLLGMLIVVILCIPLSNYSFGNDSYAISIAILSITLLITSISAGQIAILQGLRRISEMAKAILWGAFLATLITLPIYWWFGVAGIVPGMILTTIGTLLVSWLFARKVKIKKTALPFSEIIKGGWGMAKLGFFIVITGFLATLTLYIVRAFVNKEMDIDAVGYFQAAWMISNMYIGIVLNAMLADFFPRLSAVNKDNAASNKLINEQLEMALVVGAPMLIFLIACAGIVIRVLYSISFIVAIPVLQWQLAGAFIVLIMWPLGIMFLAKDKGSYCIMTDGIWSVVYLLCVYCGWEYFGFNILGIAYVVASAVKLIFVSISVKKLGKFTFNFLNIKYCFVFGFLIVAILFNVFNNTGYIQYTISTIIVIISLLYSYWRLKKVIDIKQIIKSKLLKK